jgi:hypothetical protein
MELLNEYHAIRTLELKLMELENLIKNTEEPEVKQAYSTIQTVSQVKLKDLQKKLVFGISSIVGNPVNSEGS